MGSRAETAGASPCGNAIRSLMGDGITGCDDHGTCSPTVVSQADTWLWTYSEEGRML